TPDQLFTTQGMLAAWKPRDLQASQGRARQDRSTPAGSRQGHRIHSLPRRPFRQRLAWSRSCGRDRLVLGTPNHRSRPVGTLEVTAIEAHRLAEQERLDRLKTTAERNRLGQFATPPALALDIARYAYDRWRGRSDRVSFLDPAIGTGSFYSALRQA